MNKKYELTDETKIFKGITLHRIKALKDFGYIMKGGLGGFIEKEDNLSHEGDCWIYDNTIVCGDARVYDNAKVYDNAIVCDNARVFDNARVYDNAKVYDDAEIYNNAMVCDNAMVYGDARVYGDVKVYGNAKIYDYAEVCGFAKVYNDAKVYDDARVYGDAKIGSKGYINSTDKYTIVGPIGSRKGYTTFYLDKDNNIYVSCGCFNDTIDKFIERVLKVHRNNKYSKQYLNSIEYAKTMLSI